MTKLSTVHAKALNDFELLMKRPSNYFSLSYEEQWKIDEELGALDAWCPPRLITEEMEQH